MKTADDFKQSAIKNNITKWHIRDCSLCGYRCGYLFEDNYETVTYNSGCYCVKYSGLNPRTWEDVANHYNFRKNEDNIKRYKEFWKF